MKVAFRVDASIQIGTGHVMRCLTLADKLSEDPDTRISFICRHLPSSLEQIIKKKGYDLFILPTSPSVNGKLKQLAHSSWLGVAQEADAAATLDFLQRVKCDWLVVDHYALDIRWESILRPVVKKLMVIDDLADREHDCDILLDQNLHCADVKDRYEKLVPSCCKKMLGPKYSLLRREFKEARRKLKVRDGSINRIFIFFGGSDPTNETEKALSSIQKINRPEIAVDVVVGSTNPLKEEIATFCNEFENAKIYCQINNMAQLMNLADIAIGAGGSTTWERCAVALPTLAISVADNQVSIAEGVGRESAQIYMGKSKEVTPEIISAQIEWLFQHPQKLIDISEAAQRLVDTNGSRRVVEVMRGAT